RSRLFGHITASWGTVFCFYFLVAVHRIYLIIAATWGAVFIYYFVVAVNCIYLIIAAALGAVFIFYFVVAVHRVYFSIAAAGGGAFFVFFESFSAAHLVCLSWLLGNHILFLLHDCNAPLLVKYGGWVIAVLCLLYSFSTPCLFF
ncbi:hypothetical protein NDU88_005763, partial [Pleurodeles waltl]